MQRIPLILACCLLFAAAGLGQAASATTPQTAQPEAQTLSLAPPTPNLSTLSPEELEDRGDLMRARKEFLEALDSYQAAIKKEPSARRYNKLGMIYIVMGRPSEARKPLGRALKLDPTYADARNNLAVVDYMLKRYGSAVKNFRKAIELRPDSASFHASLGTVYMDRKEYDHAMAEYRAAMQLDPDVFEHNSRFGIAGRLSSPADRARYDFEMAKLFAASGDADRALRYLRRAMEDGYPEIDKAYKDKSFAKLVTDERFTEIMKQRPVAIPQQ